MLALLSATLACGGEPPKTTDKILAFADRLRFHINQQDGFACRVDYFKDGQIVKRLDDTNVRFNEKLDDTFFTYRPRPGAEVIELSQLTP